MQWASLSWKRIPEAIKRCQVGILPLGSVENHGSHMALGTDYIVPEYLCTLIEQKVDVLILPVLPYGVCPHHMKFPGSINIGLEGLLQVVRSIAFSVLSHGLKKLVFLNGHGGNNPALDTVALEFYQKGGLAAVFDWWVLASQLNEDWKGGHADAQETAALLAIHPEMVHLEDMMDGVVQDLSKEMKTMYLNTVQFGRGTVRVAREVSSIAPSGWFGSRAPNQATPEWGKAMLEGTAEYIAQFIEAFKRVQLPST
ncbi:MAG: creatininase family protein [Spirochaetes bacterium]|nr:creatininase family protein [Spirochaetota bacterium]